MKRFRIVLVILILAIFAIGYYYYLSIQENSSNNNGFEISEVSEIIYKDLDSTYPSTPREVVALYSKIIKCYYNEEYSEDEFVKMTNKARALMDEELLGRNPYDEYYDNLKKEIRQYREDGKTINSYNLAKNSEVTYQMLQNKEYAAVTCTYYVKSDKGIEKSLQTYTLRKDGQGRWKILYWELKEPGVEDDE